MTSPNRHLALFLAAVVFATAQLPTVIQAGPTPSSMGTTSSATRQADVQTIERNLQHSAVREALQKAGTDQAQVRLLLPRMTDHDVHILATNMEQVKTGGLGVVDLLVIVLLVLIIVYLVQRV